MRASEKRLQRTQGRVGILGRAVGERETEAAEPPPPPGVERSPWAIPSLGCPTSSVLGSALGGRGTSGTLQPCPLLSSLDRQHCPQSPRGHRRPHRTKPRGPSRAPRSVSPAPCNAAAVGETERGEQGRRRGRARRSSWATPPMHTRGPWGQSGHAASDLAKAASGYGARTYRRGYGVRDRRHWGSPKPQGKGRFSKLEHETDLRPGKADGDKLLTCSRRREGPGAARAGGPPPPPPSGSRRGDPGPRWEGISTTWSQSLTPHPCSSLRHRQPSSLPTPQAIGSPCPPTPHPRWR